MWSLPKLSWASRQVRFIAIPILALILVHFVFYQKLPFQEGYTFQMEMFVSVVIWGICICEGNALVYKHLNRSLPLAQQPLYRILLQMAYGFLVTTIIYILLTLLSNFFQGDAFEWFSFLSYLLLLWAISGMENAIFMLKDLYELLLKQKETKAQIKEAQISKAHLLVKSGQRSILFDLHEIALFYSSSGLVILYTINGQKYLTQFTSLNELEKDLPEAYFFRINRQYLIHAQSIRTSKEDVNRKLQLTLLPEIANGHSGPHPVSRYRSAAFKNWIQSCSINTHA